MKYIDEYRDREAVEAVTAEIHGRVTSPWTIMEICGGQTHSIIKFGIDKLLPEAITLVHGPGCPVCVTPVELIERALAIAARPEVIFCSFGDMLRVPGTGGDLFSVKAAGGDVRIVYSPLDCLEIARQNSDREIVFFAVGFETTAAPNALAIHRAHGEGLKNISFLISQVLVPPAMEAILSSPSNRVQGFLAAGHVCTVMGYEEYEPLAEKYRVPIVVTGFEPLDILQGIYRCIAQLESGRAEVENCYTRSVKKEGNISARELLGTVFQKTSRKWRGVGEIPGSGLELTPKYRHLDAEQRFDVGGIRAEEHPDCISGQILQGIIKPPECSAFGAACTPEHPLGATMVSSEGACAAYYKYKRK